MRKYLAAIAAVLLAMPFVLSQGVSANATATPAPAAHADPGITVATRIVNFDAKGGQVLKLDVDGNAVDAHDGEIVRFGQRYYLYGTSYDCGYGLLVAGSPFCGFKVYSSPDLAHWTDQGFLFDAQTPQWQERCASPRYGCYRPHVVYNASTGKYVLWVNGYDNQSNYHVFTADTPTGPFAEGPQPTVAANRGVGVGLNNGDEDVFVDDDGTAYLAYTDIRGGHRQKVERLDSTYTSGTGEVVDLGVAGTEAPAMFKRGGRYYVTYSDPTCAYCRSTGTSYLTANSPLGPWTGASQLADAWTISAAHTLLVNGGGVGLTKAGADWTDYTFSADVTPFSTGSTGGVRYAQAGLAFRGDDAGNGYAFLLSNYPYSAAATGGYVAFVKLSNGNASLVSSAALPFKVVSGQSYRVAIGVSGSTFTATVNGTLADTVTDTAFPMGKVGFWENASDRESAAFDNVAVTAPDGSVLLADDFSGDLSKWARPAPQWQGFKINQTSCGGQPSFVSELPMQDGTGYLFGSDLWNGRPNQALAGYFWHPLIFAADGSIAPYRCDATVDLHLTAGRPGTDRVSPQRDANSANGLFRPYADGSPAYKRAQTFTVGRDGRLREVRVTTYQTGSPNAPLVLELTRLDAGGAPGEVVARREVPASAIGWSARTVALAPNLPVRAGERYAIVMRTVASRGAYGWAYDDANPYAGGGEWYAPGAGAAWRPEAGRDLRFETLVTGSSG